MPFSKPNRAHTLNGILFVTLFALSSLYLAQIPWLAQAGISSLIIAILFGMFYSNTLRHRLPNEWVPGIHFAAKKLLRLAIILYGFRISFQEIVSLGFENVVLDSLVVASTLLLGYWIGVRIFKLDRHLALLIGAGSAICGAAAVLAVEGVLKSEPYKATVAVGTVVLFGTLAMLLYPLLQHAGIFGFSAHQFGVFAGASVHEVAQALVTGAALDTTTGDTAVIVKMTRVLLLVPVLLLLSVFENRACHQFYYTCQKPLIFCDPLLTYNHICSATVLENRWFLMASSELMTRPRSAERSMQKTAVTIPWFAILFAGMIGVNSLHLLPTSVVVLINQFDIFLLTMAMAAIGIETNLNKMKHVGLKPLYLAILLFGWLTGSVWFLVRWIF